MKKLSVTKLVNADMLTTFVNDTLPRFQDTGKARDLRKIKPDPASHGKGIIIWYGCPSLSQVLELKVTCGLNVSPTDHMSYDIANSTEAELKLAMEKRVKKVAKAQEKALAKEKEDAARIRKNAKRRIARKSVVKEIKPETEKVTAEEVADAEAVPA